MALQMDLSLPNSFTATNAYCRITTIGLLMTGLDNRCIVVAHAYPDRDTARAGDPATIMATVADNLIWTGFDPQAAASPKAQCYDWLKTLDAFAGATDVLE